MAFFGFTFLFSLLGFLFILAGTSIDSWTTDNQNFGVFPSDVSVEALDGMSRVYGTVAATFTGRYGFGYVLPCPPNGLPISVQGKPVNYNKHPHYKEGDDTTLGKRAKNLNRISRGMIAMLLLSGLCGMYSSLLAILGATGSNIVSNLQPAKRATTCAVVTVLVTWALWLRAHFEYLQHYKNGCRFDSFDDEFTDIWVKLGPSWGLYIIGFVLYVVLLVFVAKGAAVDGSLNGSVSDTKIVLVALAAFAAIFTGANYNSWTRLSKRSFEIDQEQLYENLAGNVFEFGRVSGDITSDGEFHGNAFVTYNTQFGVYTAYEFYNVNIPYNDKQNQALLCPYNGGLDTDDSNKGLVQGGRITLGFAITATILAFFAVVQKDNGFWFNVLSLSCAVVSLLVWAEVADPLIRSRCCVGAGQCVIGTSYGLVAAGAAFQLFSIFYQAWIHKPDSYLPPYAYGMANKLEQELQS